MEKVFSPKLFGLIKDGSVKKNLSKDILAGIVVGIVALPLAIAFAVASGVSPEKGIITAIVAAEDAGIVTSLIKSTVLSLYHEAESCKAPFHNSKSAPIFNLRVFSHPKDIFPKAIKVAP